MISSIVLDILLLLIIAMMVPLGLLRGGLREVCTTAGLLMGLLMAEQWAGRWAPAFGNLVHLKPPYARFVMAVVIVVILGAVIGYGGSASFSSKPGPGARLYGAFLAFLNGIVVVGFLINTYVLTVRDGVIPLTIQKSWLARALSSGFHWVLLVATIGIIVATVFGMLTRERDDSITDPTFVYRPTPDDLYRVQVRNDMPQVRPLEPEVSEPAPRPQPPVRIREVRHWEEEPAPTVTDTTHYGAGWRQTWPEDGASPPWRPRSLQGAPVTPPSTKPETTGADSSRRDVLRTWMHEDRES